MREETQAGSQVRERERRGGVGGWGGCGGRRGGWRASGRRLKLVGPMGYSTAQGLLTGVSKWRVNPDPHYRREKGVCIVSLRGVSFEDTEREKKGYTSFEGSYIGVIFTLGTT